MRAALHEHLIKRGLLESEWGKFYGEVFDDRHAADYDALARFDPAATAQRIDRGEQFVAAMKRLLT